MLNQAHLTFASVYEQKNEIKCFSLPQYVGTNCFASNSVLLSLAGHLTYKLPFLNIFTHIQGKYPQFQPQTQQVNPYLSHHPLIELWCDLFSQAIMKNCAIRKQNILYILLEISNEQMNHLLKFKQKLTQINIKRESKWIDSLLKKVSGYKQHQQLPKKLRKITFLNVSGSQLRTDPYLPIINVKAVVLGQLYNNEHWQSFNILKGEIPTFEHFLQTDIAFIPGSTNSILSNIPEVNEMSKNLFRAFQVNEKLKIFGICYGHQLIAHKNNGYVVKKKRTDWVEKYKFEEKLIQELKEKFTFLQKMAIHQNQTYLLEHHEDYVQQVSDEFHILASSQSCKVQCLLHKSGRMLSFQSHPEYFLDYSQGYMSRIMKYKYNQVERSSKKINNYKDRKAHQESSLRIRGVIKDFFAFETKKICEFKK